MWRGQLFYVLSKSHERGLEQQQQRQQLGLQLKRNRDVLMINDAAYKILQPWMVERGVLVSADFDQWYQIGCSWFLRERNISFFEQEKRQYESFLSGSWDDDK